MSQIIQLPSFKSLRPLLVLLVFFALWDQREALQRIADAASVQMVQLDAACADKKRP